MRAGLGLAAVVVLLIAGGLALAVRSGAPPSDSRVAPLAPAPAPTPPAPSADPAPALDLDAAARELELIRPARVKAASDFTLPTLGGKTFRLTEQRGKAVFINFWATWCAPCREEMPAMERLWRRRKDDGFVMVAISLDADPAVVPAFVAEHGLTFPIALDPSMDVANLYGVRALPTSLIVDRMGDVRALAFGPRRWDHEAADALVAWMAR